MIDRAHTSPWPKRAAYAAVLVTMPIFLLGGTVTTLHVGMAVPDWPTTFGHNMFTYPLRDMLKDSGVFWEHSHRLWGAFVGVVVLALAVVTWMWESRRAVKRFTLAALVVVALQGVLGGLRVLFTSTKLAFLHGMLAQLIFALLVAIALMYTPSWFAATIRPCKRASGLRRASIMTALLVYAQIVVGGALRHFGDTTVLALHIAIAVVASGALIVLARDLRLTAEEGARGGHDRSVLLRVRRWIVNLLAAQLALGVLAAVWIFIVTGPQNPVSIGEAIFATAHVLVGALLLGSCAAAAVFAHRLVEPGERSVAVPAGAEAAQ